MFERYTAPSRRTIFFARWWALNRGAVQIETFDIILGAAIESRAPESPFRWMNLDQTSMVALFAEGIPTVPNPEAKDIPLSDSSKRALAYAAEEVDSEHRYSLEIYHLVRGVLRTGDQTAQTLIATGFDLDTLRAGSRDANRKLGDERRTLQFKTQMKLLQWRLRLSGRVIFAILILLLAISILYLHSQN